MYAVAYAHNGRRFASGGADNTVIIWTSNAEGILKYTHNDSIQALAYNPVTQQLASGTSSDLGLWSPEQKAVAKLKVSSRITCLSWTSDGSTLALGCFDGSVSLRDKAGAERLRIDAGQAPVYSLSFNPADPTSLAVGCLSGTLRFFSTADGKSKSKDRELPAGCDPLCLSYFANGEYMAVAGTDASCQLYTKDGTLLCPIASRGAWIWCAAPRPKHNHVAVGTEDGSIALYQLVFSTVHGLYQDRYAYRDLMTDVIIQHLITEQKVRIKCRDYVKKIAVYKDRLAVQLPSKIIIYRLSHPDDEYDMHYTSATKILQKLDCNLLVVTSHHLILCQERRLQLYSFDGVKEREWAMDSVIRYIKVVGGPPKREGIIVGTKSGAIFKIFIDNAFPIPLINHTSAVRCLDLSPSRRKLAVVDESSHVLVYDLGSKELLFEEANANSVAWNTESDDMLCFSGGGQLSIKTGDFPLTQQKLQGFVVGFKGSKIFCLHFVAMNTIDVPQSASMHRYLERKDYARAYATACLGVTDADWRALALEALGAMQLDIARQAFVRTRDVRYVELVNRTELGRKSGVDERALAAEVAAYQGKFTEAARLYTAAGCMQKAIDLFGDMRMFDEAKRWAEAHAGQAGSGGGGMDGLRSKVEDLMSRQAEWSEETKNYASAVEMYVRGRKWDRAVSILVKQGWWERLTEVVRLLDRAADAKTLATCGAAFRKAGQFESAKETYIKLDDVKSLLGLYVEAGRWDDCLLLINAHPEFRSDVYLPYGRHLAGQDRFEEARLAFRDGGRPDLATKMLEQLAHNAVLEGRFADAAFYFYLLAQDAMACIGQSSAAGGGFSAADAAALAQFQSLYAKAEIYYAYDYIHKAVTQPFATCHPSTVFNVARFLLMRSLRTAEPPYGVSLANVLYVLAKQAGSLGANKLARFAFTKLQSMVLPPVWQAEVELQSVLVRAQPFADEEELLPVCYRCGTTNPLLNTQGDVCTACGAPFVRSFVTFEHLPLVEFELEPGISDEEAQRIMGEAVGSSLGLGGGGGGGGMGGGGGAKRGGGGGGADVLRITDDDGYGGAVDRIADPFSAQMAAPNAPIRVDRATLRRLKVSEVIVRKWPNPAIPHQYFRVMDEELPLCTGPCGHFFEQDEFEMAALEQGRLPFSRDKLRGESADAGLLGQSTLGDSSTLDTRVEALKRVAAGASAAGAGSSRAGRR